MVKEPGKPADAAAGSDYAAGHLRDFDDRRSYLNSGHSLAPELVEQIKLRLDPGAKVLEVGCGGGHTAAFLERIGFKVTAVDLSPVAVDAARRNYPKIDFRQGDGTSLDFTGGVFDAVVTVEFIEHIKEVGLHLREVKRVLRPRGYYFVKTPNKKLHDIYYRRRPDVAFWHPSVMDGEKLREVLETEGFAVEFVRMRRLPTYQIKKAGAIMGPAARLAELLRILPLKWLPPGWQPSLICLAQKREEQG